MIYGNFAALPQTNLKRLLAYSSIAHAGYLLIGVVTFSGAAVAYYLVAYLLMTLLCFAVLIVVGNQSRGSDRGLRRTRETFAVSRLRDVDRNDLAGGSAIHRWISWANSSSSMRPSGNIRPCSSSIGVITVGCGFYYYLKVVRAIYWLEPTRMRRRSR